MFRSMYISLLHGVPFTSIICIIMGQEFILVPEPVHQLTGENHSIELIWDFDNNSIPLSGTTWRNGNNVLVMRKAANQPPVVSNNFIDKVFYRSPFGLSIWNLTREDEGEYSCKVVYTGGEKESKVNVTLYNVIGGLSPKIELYDDDEEIMENGTEVNVESKVLAKYLVPIQNPVAIVTSISTDFDGIVEIRETCVDYNGTYCEATFMAPDETGELIISACNSHPALKETMCEKFAVNIIDPDKLSSSLAPDDTSFSSDNPPPTEDPNALTSSVAPVDTSVSTYTPSSTEDRGSGCGTVCIVGIVVGAVLLLLLIPVILTLAGVCEMRERKKSWFRSAAL